MVLTLKRNEGFDLHIFTELSQLEDLNTNRITRILTTDFPQYFAIVSRIRQEVHAIGPEGKIFFSTISLRLRKRVCKKSWFTFTYLCLNFQHPVSSYWGFFPNFKILHIYLVHHMSSTNPEFWIYQIFFVIFLNGLQNVFYFVNYFGIFCLNENWFRYQLPKPKEWFRSYTIPE